MKSRSEVLQQIEGGTFDVCIIGGGATGAGCAVDAQLRGLKTVVIEAGDYSAATSSSSTKLVHGGVRYLQEAVQDLDAGQYHVVKRALHERRLMLDNAPYLAHPLELLVPCYSRMEALYYGIGMKMYDWIAGKGNLFPSKYRSVAESVKRMPMLKPDRLTGTVAYGDGQFDDARYGMALIQSFADEGGLPVNYARVVGLEKDAGGRLKGADVEDLLTHRRFKVQARAFINATGPFSDHIRQMAKPGIASRLRLSKGVHILVPLDQESTKDAILIPKTDDCRVIFAIPWLGRFLVGTTDDEAQHGDEMIVKKEEAEYLLRHLNRYLVSPMRIDEIVSGFAGVRPLVKSKNALDTKKLIRDHEVEMEEESGLISVLGGKWTTHRAMAQDGVDMALGYLGMPLIPCRTPQHKLHGATGWGPDFWQLLVSECGASPAAARHLSQKFGTASFRVLDIAKQDPRYAAPIVPGLAPIQAEIVYSVQQEMAQTIEDMLARRLGLQLFSWAAAIKAAPVVGSVMAELLGWTAEQTNQAVEQYVQKITRMMTAIGLRPEGVRVKAPNRKTNS
jgi:glycerol-3-phosphate dehydrogenase